MIFKTLAVKKMLHIRYDCQPDYSQQANIITSDIFVIKKRKNSTLRFEN